MKRYIIPLVTTAIISAILYVSYPTIQRATLSDASQPAPITAPTSSQPDATTAPTPAATPTTTPITTPTPSPDPSQTSVQGAGAAISPQTPFYTTDIPETVPTPVMENGQPMYGNPAQTAPLVTPTPAPTTMLILTSNGSEVVPIYTSHPVSHNQDNTGGGNAPSN